MRGGGAEGAGRFLNSQGKSVFKDIKEMQMSGLGGRERSRDGRWAQDGFPSIIEVTLGRLYYLSEPQFADL